MKNLTLTFFFALLLLAGCATNGETPTPTITPLDQTATVASQSRVEKSTTSTPTSIPMPSPTPTVTPMAAIDAAAPAADTFAAPAADTPEATSSDIRPQVKITTYALRVREGPGTDYPFIGTAVSGDRFEIEGTNDAGDWLQISFKGQSGWIAANPKYTQLPDGDVADVATVKRVPPPVQASVTQKHATEAQRQLVFATSSGGDLYSVNIDGSNLKRLAGGVIDPVVSPDGAQVAFTRWDGAEFGTLYAFDLSSGEERVVATEIRQPKSPAWSPDGQQIVISFQHGGRRDPKRQCRKFSPDEPIRIPENSEILWVGIQPDGRIKICFIRNEDLHWFLRQIDVASGQFEDLPSGEYAYSPTWDPQNAWRVIYSGNRGLMQFDMNTRQQWPLTGDLRDKAAVFSPDGRRLAITYKQHDHWEIHTVDLETGARQRLTKPPILVDPQYNSAAPIWSPDGSQIAFFTDRTGSWEIWLMDADGGNPRPLLPPDVQSQLPLEYHGVHERLLNWH